MLCLLPPTHFLRVILKVKNETCRNLCNIFYLTKTIRNVFISIYDQYIIISEIPRFPFAYSKFSVYISITVCLNSGAKFFKDIFQSIFNGLKKQIHLFLSS